METTLLPNTDISVSRLAFGCWGITGDFHWGDRDAADSLAAIHAAIDAGVNFFDTAEMYADGESEKLLGRAVADRRARVVIATKAGPGSMRPAEIVAACERSLKRLGTDYIDLYQTHWFADRDIPPAETWGAMMRLRAQGKARAIGISNGGTGDLRDLCELEPPVTNQLPYNLLWRSIEPEILPDCRARGVGVLVYSPLMHGLLSAAYETADAVPAGRARTRHFASARAHTRHGEPGCEEETFATLAELRRISESSQRPLAATALAWLGAKPGVTSIIAGARTRRQLAANVAAVGTKLPEEDVAALDTATEALKATLGDNPDLWQGAGRSRFR